MENTNSLHDNCTVASTSSDDVCGERSGLQILDEFKKLYEGRIESVDSNNPNASDVKMKIMEEWINDLHAQNVMLAKTVQELEEAAYQRVKILEDKLKHTSNLITDNMALVEEPRHHELNDLTDRLDYLQQEDEILKQKINNFQNDITGLIELVRRGYYERRWSLDGINLYELKAADIPIPFGSDRRPHDDRLPENKELTNQEPIFNEWSQSSTAISNQLELINLKEELRNQNEQVERWKEKCISIQKEFAEGRESLTLEVAQKHDQIMNLKDKIENITEQCDQISKQMHFKDEIIKEMRSQLKQQKERKEIPLSHPVQDKKGPQVRWDCVLSHEQSQEKESFSDESSEDFPNLKTIVENEQDNLIHIKDNLIEILRTFNFNEEKAYKRGLADAHEKLQSMENLLENYNIQKSWEDSDCNTFISHTNKLTEAIEILSKICLSKENQISQVLCTFQNSLEKTDKIERESIEKQGNISRQDFKVMEEFRVCTVEAQAAVEDLQEKITSIVSNLSCRHQLFIDLKIALDNSQEEINKTDDELSDILDSLKKHIDEKLMTKERMISGREKLHDFKNKINKCLVELKLLTAVDQVENSCNNLMDNVIDEIEYILCHLQVFITKEESTYDLLNKSRDLVKRLEDHLSKFKKFSDCVLRDDKSAKDIYEQNWEKLEKLESELDDAHTRMQNNLENIVQRSQQDEYVHDLSSDSQEGTSHRYDDSTSQSISELEELKGIVTSKDKLIHQKDEIIKIQKESIYMTQEEMRNLQRKLEEKINTHLEEKKHLLKEIETIEHLRKAVVDGKKNSDRLSSQKSVSDVVWTSITPAVFNNGDVHDI
ncbi:A-kinase anchor protein 9 isoform X2 [Fopius arisanus]|uniref:A-kinase anchor protein 9 isoform X2 n=1 Tax=Fopius arisanus TaxID=64838 RepID=A0A9R1TBP9_9HYME|nr:PREDICTED: A-kinase anchor protein 9-like isoform X2 [Fopius arisanus]